MLVLVSGTLASAAIGNIEGTVDSGGLGKYLRRSGLAPESRRLVSLDGTQGSGVIALRKYSCTNYGFLGPEAIVPPNTAVYLGPSRRDCFRIYARRANAVDTNGILRGNGTTTFRGQIRW
jgi:hypothetical protein